MDQQTAIPAEEPHISSWIERATDLFAAPGKLFAEVSSTPVQSTSWAIPFTISICMALIVTIAIFSNQSLRDQIMTPQIEQLQQRVEKGEMTQEQADRATEFMQGSAMPLIFGSMGAILVVTVTIFGATLALWLITKFVLKTSLGYKKMLEVYGLSMLIGILNAIITLIMMHMFNSVHATPGGSILFMNNFDYKNFIHSFVSSMNIFSIWQTAVVGIGVAKVSNKSIGTGMMIAFGLWLIWIILASLLGWGMR